MEALSRNPLIRGQLAEFEAIDLPESIHHLHHHRQPFPHPDPDPVKTAVSRAGHGFHPGDPVVLAHFRQLECLVQVTHAEQHRRRCRLDRFAGLADRHLPKSFIVEIQLLPVRHDQLRIRLVDLPAEIARPRERKAAAGARRTATPATCQLRLHERARRSRRSGGKAPQLGDSLPLDCRPPGSRGLPGTRGAISRLHLHHLPGRQNLRLCLNAPDAQSARHHQRQHKPCPLPCGNTARAPLKRSENTRNIRNNDRKTSDVRHGSRSEVSEWPSLTDSP